MISLKDMKKMEKAVNQYNERDKQKAYNLQVNGEFYGTVFLSDNEIMLQGYRRVKGKPGVYIMPNFRYDGLQAGNAVLFLQDKQSKTNLF